MKLSSSIFWMIGGIFILIGVGLWLFERYGPSPVPQPLAQEDDPFAAEIRVLPTPTKLLEVLENMPDPVTPELLQANKDTLAREMLLPTHADPFEFGSLNLRGGFPIKAIFHLEHGGYSVPEFPVYQWTPGIFDTGIFDVGSGNAISYSDIDNRTILLVHSGKNQTMTPIQNYFELSESGYLESLEIVEGRIDGLVIGNGEVYLSQFEKYEYAMVAAGVRVPPSDVDEVSLHIMDLVEHLGQRYPDSGFDKLGSDAIVLYFCGRALEGEELNPNFGHWSQARFVLGLVPLEVVDEVQDRGQYRD